MRIYCARPMAGHSYDEVAEYYNEIGGILKELGFEFLNPMTGKSYLAGRGELKCSGYKEPLSNDHAIIERDRWMVKSADIVFVNLLNCKKVSIGSMMELAWGFDFGLHTIVVMEEDNIHRHAFVNEAAHVIFTNLNEALDYLAKLAKAEI